MLAVTITTLALMHRSALPQAMVTDFDAWHPDHDSVTGERMLELFRANNESNEAVVQDNNLHTIFFF